LIFAEYELHAFLKARSMGEREYMKDGLIKQVKWKFIDVSELHLLSEFIEGVEIYSKIKEVENADLYILNTQKRAVQLLQIGLHNFTATNN